MNSIWIITREYAGIAESGGLKNVVTAIAKELSQLNIKTTVFIPLYGCITNKQTIKQGKMLFNTNIKVGQKTLPVNFYGYKIEKVNFIFIDAEIFFTKQNIYTYTQQEALIFSANNFPVKKGDGYIDTNYINIFFQKAIIEFAKAKKLAPTVIHCHDAHTAFLPALIFNDPSAKNIFKNTKCFITIHNAGNGYRQNIGYAEAKKLTGLDDTILQSAEINGQIETFLLGSMYAKLTTVSPWYALELKNNQISKESSIFSKDFSIALTEKNIDIVGITNGINYNTYDPSKKENSLLPYSFEINKEKIKGKYLCRDFFINKFCNYDKIKPADGIEFIGKLDIKKHQKYLYLFYHGRIAEQKGISTLCKVIPNILNEYKNIRFIIAGQGAETLEKQCSEVANTYFGKCLFIKGYNKSLIRLATAISDFIILPSLFEPCGMEDFISQIFACIPIANAVGGLNKIQHNKTGFLYHFDVNSQNNSEEEHNKKLTEIILNHSDAFFKSDKQFLLDNDYYFEIIKEANKNIINHFSWKEIINTYLTLYAEN